MKNLSLKAEDKIFEETEKISAQFNINRNEYINNAASFYNSVQKRNTLASNLIAESKLVHEESMRVLSEFEILEDENTTI